MDAEQTLQRHGEHFPDQVLLATYMSLAATITPEKLRSVRTKFHPTMDPRIESKLWVGPLIEAADHDTCIIDRRMVGLLRERLPKEDIEALWNVITQFSEYRHPALALVLEEELNYLSLSGAPEEKNSRNPQAYNRRLNRPRPTRSCRLGGPGKTTHSGRSKVHFRMANH